MRTEWTPEQVSPVEPKPNGYRLAEPRFFIETAGGEVLASLYHLSNAEAEAKYLSRRRNGQWLVIRDARGNVHGPSGEKPLKAR